jgi:hypothetical protein
MKKELGAEEMQEGEEGKEKGAVDGERLGMGERKLPD